MSSPGGYILNKGTPSTTIIFHLKLCDLISPVMIWGPLFAEVIFDRNYLFQHLMIPDNAQQQSVTRSHAGQRSVTLAQWSRNAHVISSESQL